MSSSEITIKIENIAELECVQAEIERLKRKVSKYHRLYQQANGKAMRYARSRDYHIKNNQFYKNKIVAILAVLPDDANWHNAPDYIRHFKAQMSAHSKQANHYQKLYETLRQTSMGIEKVQEMALELMNSRVANTNYFSDIDKRNDALEFIEEWRRNNDC